MLSFRPGTRVSKNKTLKISQHRPSGSRVKFDEEGNPVAPLAIVAATTETEVALDEGKASSSYVIILFPQTSNDTVIYNVCGWNWFFDFWQRQGRITIRNWGSN